jgi:predicted tellurium resistance membrane protein TerC
MITLQFSIDSILIIAGATKSPFLLVKSLYTVIFAGEIQHFLGLTPHP